MSPCPNNYTRYYEVLNTPSRADALYAQWIIARDHAEAWQATSIKVWQADDVGVMMAGLSGFETKRLEAKRLPGPCSKDWAERVRVARQRAGLDRASARASRIKHRGITIYKRWEWTGQREREERDSVARLSMGSGGFWMATQFADETDDARRTP